MTSITSFVRIEKNELGTIIEDENIQEFEGLNFMIKVETLSTEDNNARLFFLDLNNREQNIPNGLICSDITYGNEFIKNRFPGTQCFLLNYPLKYQITYNGKKICQINSEKKFVIYNFKRCNK